MTDAAGKNFIDLTASIVSAYVSNNPTQAADIPALIGQVHAALLRVSTGRAEPPLEPAPAPPPRPPAAGAGAARRAGEEIRHGRISGVSGGRQTLQVAEAAPAQPV